MHNLRVMRIAYFMRIVWKARCPRWPFWHLQL